MKPLFRRAWFWAAVAAGTVLRGAGLLDQVIAGDERHAFAFAVLHSLRESLFTWSETANSPPLNAWLRLLIALGMQPSELALRLPIAASGLAALVLVPRWVARRLDPRIATWTAWLIATAPLLVFYSRFMRPYMPYALLTAVAAGAFFDWWRERRIASGIAYAVCAALAVYLHLLAAPFVLAPFAFLALERAVGGRQALPPWRQIAAPAGSLALLLALFVAPAWSELTRLVANRRVPLELHAQDLWALPLRLAGSGVLWLTLLFWAAALYGAVRLARRDAPLLRYGLCLVLAQVVAIPLLSPKFIANGIIFSRYALPVLIPVLVAVALALAEPPLPRARLPWRLAAAGLLAALFFVGPLRDRELYLNPYAVRPQALLPPRRARSSPAVPDLYRQLAAGPRGTVIEAPARPVELYLDRLALYQRVHRRAGLVAPGDGELTDDRLALRTVAPAEPAELLATGAAFLVLHRDWAAELGPSRGIAPSAPPDLERRLERELAASRRQARSLERRLTEAWGEPDLEGGGLAAWDLGRARRGAPE